MNAILKFWFEGLTDGEKLDWKDGRVKKWFAKNEKFDNDIRERFEKDIQKAQRREYKDWEDSARGRLALILLFDQFTRNIYRGTLEMFKLDSLALDLTLRSLQDKKDQELQLIERVFLCMPLMHAENLEMQNQAVTEFEKLVQESEMRYPQNIDYYKYSLDYAYKHRDIVQRFGRFPHRNVILRRTSTLEEEKFLTKPGSSF